MNENSKIKPYFLCLALCLIIGVSGGVIGALFSRLIALVTAVRTSHSFLIYLLPVGGLAVVFLYEKLKINGQNTNRVLESADGENTLNPFLLIGIFVSSVISHLFGASVGREGAALQLGGSISLIFSKWFKINEDMRKILTRAGMAAVFSAVFGTPIAAFLFPLEIVTVGKIHYKSAFPSLVASFTAFYTAKLCGAESEMLTGFFVPSFSLSVLLKIAVITTLTAALSIAFCHSLHLSEKLAEKLIKNPYIRIIAGSALLILLTLIVGNNDYNGGGMNVVERVFYEGKFVPYAFALKLLFTAVSVGVGFKGGEIVPTLFIGALFGAALGASLGLPVAFAASLGMILLFCGVTNCPLTSIALAFELFAATGFWYFIPTVAFCFLLSGKISLYSSQKNTLPCKFY